MAWTAGAETVETVLETGGSLTAAGSNAAVPLTSVTAAASSFSRASRSATWRPAPAYVPAAAS